MPMHPDDRKKLPWLIGGGVLFLLVAAVVIAIAANGRRNEEREARARGERVLESLKDSETYRRRADEIRAGSPIRDSDLDLFLTPDEADRLRRADPIERRRIAKELLAKSR